MHASATALRLATVTLTAAVPALSAQSVPRIVAHSGSQVTVELPAAQSVVVLGVSIYGDIRLLYPAAGEAGVVSAVQSKLLFDGEGPWLADGRQTAVASSSGAPRNYCSTDHSLLAQLAEQQSGRQATRLCTWLPNPPTITLVGPALHHLVVLGTNPIPQPFPLDSVLTGFRADGNANRLAAALSARLNPAGSPPVWWVLAVDWHKRASRDVSPCMGACEGVRPSPH